MMNRKGMKRTTIGCDDACGPSAPQTHAPLPVAPPRPPPVKFAPPRPAPAEEPAKVFMPPPPPVVYEAPPPAPEPVKQAYVPPQPAPEVLVVPDLPPKPAYIPPQPTPQPKLLYVPPQPTPQVVVVPPQPKLAYVPPQPTPQILAPAAPTFAYVPPPATQNIAKLAQQGPASSGEDVSTGQASQWTGTAKLALPAKLSGLLPKIGASGQASYYPAGQVNEGSDVPVFVPLFADPSGALYYPAGQARNPGHVVKDQYSGQQNVTDTGVPKQDFTQGVDPRVFDLVGQSIGVVGGTVLEAIRQGNETERARIAAAVQQSMQSTMQNSGISDAERQAQLAAQQDTLARLHAAAAQDNQELPSQGMSPDTKKALMYGGIALGVVTVAGVVVYIIKARKNPTSVFRKMPPGRYAKIHFLPKATFLPNRGRRVV